MFLTGQAMGEAVVDGGWSVIGNGDGASRGTNEITYCSGDPSVTLGITSSVSTFGPGTFSDSRTGSQNLEITLAGFDISLGYDGTVSSNVTLTSSGSASSSAYVGATATGIATGNRTYDIFGAADISTKSYLSGTGTTGASAEGSSEYDVARIGTLSEVWGNVSGKSSVKLQGLSPDAYASTGGSENGLHMNSRATLAANGLATSSSTSQITSYASVINNSWANVSSSGTAIGGAWDPSFTGTKSKLRNENVAARVTGELRGYTEANDKGDAGDVSAVLNAEASRDPDLHVSGGPATYASSYQSSGAARTYSETWAERSIWGSFAKTGEDRIVVEWGNLSGIGSGAHTHERDAGATSFGKVQMDTNYTTQALARARGKMVLSTLSEATTGKDAVAGTFIGPKGEGFMCANDGSMTNTATFIGGMNGFQDLFHFSYVKPVVPEVSTYNIVGRASVVTTPHGTELIAQPFFVSTELDPNIAWSRTEGSYDQSH